MKSLYSVWKPLKIIKYGIKVKGKHTEDYRNHKTLSENNVKKSEKHKALLKNKNPRDVFFESSSH